MVRQRKHDSKSRNQKDDVGQGNSPKQKQRPPEDTSKPTAEDTSKPTAEDMHYVSNSRSRARSSGSPVVPSGLLRWLFRLKLTKLFLVVLLIGGLGFVAGRIVYQKFIFDNIKRLHVPAMPNDNQNDHRKTPYLHTEIKDGVVVQHFGPLPHVDKDLKQKIGIKELEERHAALHAASVKNINEQKHTDNRHHQEHPKVPDTKQQHVAQQQRAQQQKEAQEQDAKKRALQQHLAKQQAAQQQHVAQQSAALHAKLNQSKLQQPAAIPTPKQHVTNQQPSAKKTKVQDSPSDIQVYPYHIIQTLTNTHKMPHLKQRFIDCTKSILDKASINLHFFFVVDKQSRPFVMEALQKITDEGIAKSKFQFHLIEIDELAHQIAPLVSLLQEHVTGGHPYYQDAIFFLSVAIHRHILPEYVHRIIMLDTDMKFMTDIKGLFDHFDRFTGDNIMGIAREMQPVYRHLLSLYRNQNKGTKVGDPPPDGLTGFNSGVLLLDLEKMRTSAAYRGFINSDKIAELTKKYTFKGHLGDQDFFSLISLEKPDLFHILPCSWNRQLCTWWRDKGYKNVFDLYFKCEGTIDVYHGNCNTPIPY